MNDDVEDLLAGLEHTLFRPVAADTVVRVRGSDARSFLHSLSTQDTATQPAGTGRLNTFLDRKGRLVDVVHQVVAAEDDVWLLGQCPGLGTHLDAFLFSEDVALAAGPSLGDVVRVIGHGAWATLRALLTLPVDVELAQHEAVVGTQGIVVRTFDVMGQKGAVPAYLALTPGLSSAALTASFLQHGARELPAALDDALGVAAGVPRAPEEISDETNPLELALHAAIHWSKGCYIGQEVIARIDNLGKQARYLVALSIPADAPLPVPGEVLVDDNGVVVGRVTRTTPWRLPSPLPVALALVRLRDAPVGAVVRYTVSGGVVVAATVGARAAAQTPHD